MMKLTLTTIFAIAISALLIGRNLELAADYRQLSFDLPEQDCSGQILGWYDACVNSNLLRSETLQSFGRQAYPIFYMGIIALLFSLAFLIVLTIVVYVEAAYAQLS